MRIKVYSKQHTMFAALYLVQQLDKLGHDASIVANINRNDDSLHIIYNASACPVIPNNYIVYQTEVPGSPWFNGRYYEVIAGAKAVWEYSACNIDAYKAHNGNIAIVRPGIFPQTVGTKDIDYLFYGHLQAGNRRVTMVDTLRKQLGIRVVTNTLGNEMWRLLARTKVVINLHFYRNAPLEQFRVCEALSFGCHVVSERSICGDDRYSEVVSFGTMPEIIESAKSLSQKPFEYDVERFDNLREVEAGLYLV